MKNFLIVVAGSVIVGTAYNLFFIPHKILSSGLSGIAILLGLITPVNTGVLNFVLNLPLLVLSVFKLGKKFTLLTVSSVISLSLSLYLLPVVKISSEPILSSLFGGIFTGLGIGLIFRASGSSGGFDIIAMFLAKKKDFPLGAILSALNGVVVIASGFVFGWDAAFNTLVAIFACGKVIDAIHTRHIKLTLMIITSKGEEMKTRLLEKVYRGITMMDGKGAYSGDSRKILLMVITRYELTEVKNLVRETDPGAFVNILETAEVVGSFHRN
ncbi:membrane protein [Weizmannia acidilactici]|uniref:Membrane protein n=1 Tax=Weizmannia acidilactici TaxID=2607726 RepID=A0A5J4J1I9_9BACI|nr:YitT family protein [Weizmannia acidilactici]GER67694.1 membrane protein [Weizmannia acidilactici]GER68932.1 membrane protein [Weizmannia acidilactici]GER73886.1 membrane protein [Weizmannia acidilactici]